MVEAMGQQDIHEEANLVDLSSDEDLAYVAPTEDDIEPQEEEETVKCASKLEDMEPKRDKYSCFANVTLPGLVDYDPTTGRKRITAPKIPALSRLELAKLSQHQCIPAMYLTRFGGDPLGVHRCSPTGVLHPFLLGFLKGSMCQVVGAFSPSAQKVIDLHALSLIKDSRQTESRYLPHIDFT
jgi:hypothetical protein